ncbi:MAG: hypothetical protein SOW59_02015 [Corynebacterium sp.]|nr:hypothetical protein [Corynebacterium sp.]
MRNFRTAAVAVATAAVVSISGISAASAETVDYDFGKSLTESTKALVDASKSDSVKDAPTFSAGLGKELGAYDEQGNPTKVKAQDLLGSTVETDVPAWAKIWRDGTYLAVITAVLGGLIGAYNFAVYNGVFPHIFS